MKGEHVEEQVGIIRDVEFGLRDIGVPCLSFTVFITEVTAALQVFTNGEDIKQILQDAGATKVEMLEGMPCWCEVSGSRIVFKRVWRPR